MYYVGSTYVGRSFPLVVSGCGHEQSRNETRLFYSVVGGTVSPLFFCFNPLASSRSVASSNVMFVKKENPRLLQLENAIEGADECVLKTGQSEGAGRYCRD